MAKKKCIAEFVPQAWVNDHAIEVDGRREFDITTQVKAMGREASLDLKDDTYESDELAREAGLLRDHSGPFYVRAESAILSYWGE